MYNFYHIPKKNTDDISEDTKADKDEDGGEKDDDTDESSSSSENDEVYVSFDSNLFKRKFKRKREGACMLHNSDEDYIEGEAVSSDSSMTKNMHRHP